MKIITEEMRYRKRLCEYAIKSGLEKSIETQKTDIFTKQCKGGIIY